MLGNIARIVAQFKLSWSQELEDDAIVRACEELREDHRKDDILAEAIGMNDPAIKFTGKPRSLSTEERVRLGL